MTEQNNNAGAGNSKTGKKERIKSPMYPSISFSDALSKTRLLWNAERRAATTADILYKHLGYSKKNGASARVVAAMKQYGLIEEKGGMYKVSDATWRFFNLPEDSPEKLQIEKDLAMRPRIFKEILANYPDGLPSDPTLKSYLILEKSFNENGAHIFIKVFKAAIKFAESANEEYNDSYSFEEDFDEDFGDGEMAGKINAGTVGAGSGVVKIPPPIKDGTRITIDIPSEGEIKISFTGDVNMKTFQFVNGILELQKEMFPEKAKSQETKVSEIEHDWVKRDEIKNDEIKNENL